MEKDDGHFFVKRPEVQFFSIYFFSTVDFFSEFSIYTFLVNFFCNSCSLIGILEFEFKCGINFGGQKLQCILRCLFFSPKEEDPLNEKNQEFFCDDALFMTALLEEDGQQERQQ